MNEHDPVIRLNTPYPHDTPVREQLAEVFELPSAQKTCADADKVLPEHILELTTIGERATDVDIEAYRTEYEKTAPQDKPLFPKGFINGMFGTVKQKVVEAQEKAAEEDAAAVRRKVVADEVNNPKPPRT